MKTKKYRIELSLDETQYQTLLKFSGGNRRKCSANLRLAMDNYLASLASLITIVEVQHAAEAFAKLTGSVKRLKEQREE